MSRADVIRMAREHNFRVEFESGQSHQGYEFSEDELIGFTDRVIADFLQRTGQYVTNDASREAAIAAAVAVEREACAQILDANAAKCTTIAGPILEANASAIRVRGAP